MTIGRITIFAVDINFQVQILIFTCAPRSAAVAPAALLARDMDRNSSTHSLLLMSISRVSFTARGGGDGGAGGGGGVGERALSTPGKLSVLHQYKDLDLAYHDRCVGGA